MRRSRPPGCRATMSVEGRGRNGNGHLGAHAGRAASRTAHRPPRASSRSARNTMRRNADAAADQQRARPLGMRRRSRGRSGPRTLSAVARLARASACKPGLRPPCRASRSSPRAASARMSDSGRRIGMVGIAGQVREAAGPGVRGAARRVRGAARTARRRRPCCRDDAACLEEDRAAVQRGSCARAMRRRAHRHLPRAPPSARRRRCAPDRGSPTAGRRRRRRRSRCRGSSAADASRSRRGARARGARA